MIADLKVAARFLRHSPVWSGGVILTLVLGITGLALVTGVLDAALFQPVSQVDSSTLFTIYRTHGPQDHRGLSLPDLDEIGASLEGQAGVAGFARFRPTVDLGNDPRRLDAQLVTGEYFRILRARPHLGRLLDDSDQAPGAPVVAVLGYESWRDLTGSNPDVIGQRIHVNRTPVTVVGVGARGFGAVGWRTDLWFSVQAQPSVLPTGYELLSNDEVGWLSVVGRREAAATAASVAARIRLTGIAADELGERVANTVWRANFIRLWPGHIRRFGEVLLVVAALAGAVLAVSTLNGALLWCARSAERDAELSVRASLGATPKLLARRASAEIVLLGSISLAVSVLLVSVLAPAVPRLSFGIPVAMEVAHLPRLLAATGLIAAVSCGLLAALSSLVGRGVEVRRRRPRLRLLPAATFVQAATACVVAGLAIALAARVVDVLETRAGIEPESLALFQLQLTGESYPSGRVPLFLRSLEAELGTTPGIVEVGISSRGPFDMPRRLTRVAALDAGGGTRSAIVSSVSPGYFALMRTALLAGRGFAWSDDASAEPVVVVDRLLADQIGGGASLVGTRVRLDDAERPLTVVGVVSAETHHPLTADVGRAYVPFSQDVWPTMTVLLRSAGGTATVLDRAENTLVTLDSQLVADRPRQATESMLEASRHELDHSRLAVVLAAVVAAISLLGATSTVSYTIGRARPALAIRLALGATDAQVRRHAVRRYWSATALAIGIGTAVAVFATPVVGLVLAGVSTAEVFRGAVLAGAVLLAAASGLLWWSTRSVSRIQPGEILRSGGPLG